MHLRYVPTVIPPFMGTYPVPADIRAHHPAAVRLQRTPSSPQRLLSDYFAAGPSAAREIGVSIDGFLDCPHRAVTHYELGEPAVG